MQKTRQPFNQLINLAIFIVMSLCYRPVFAETTETKAHHSQNSLDWPGIYYGFLPCDDCKGIKAKLALNKNNTYIFITQYIGKSEREFVEKGKYTEGNESNTLVLTPRNSSASKYYLVDENKLIQLDDDGNRITGKLADRYILRRNDVTSESQMPHSSH
jgi:copper homeostasis protein (lipoprotein)